MIINIVFILVICILLYTVYNVYHKLNISEKYVADLIQVIDLVKTNTQQCKDNLAEIDTRGVFSSDDEVGMAFDVINDNIKTLNDFLNSIYEERKEENK